MARLFWVVCPKCGKKFYAATIDFRGKDRKMQCPFCAVRFTDQEAAEIVD